MLYRGMIRDRKVEVGNRVIDIPRRIIFLRTIKEDMTQEELANKLGVTASAVCSWEKGRCTPGSGMIHKICDVFGISVQRFIEAESNYQLI